MVPARPPASLDAADSAWETVKVEAGLGAAGTDVGMIVDVGGPAAV